MGTFRLNFDGLCHFIENKDTLADVQMCVVMPDASGYDVIPDHVSKLFFKGGKAITGESQPSWFHFLRRQRVSFEFYRGGEPLDPGEVIFGSEGERGVITMEEIAGDFADQNLGVMAVVPPSNVQAQIILDRGVFKASADETDWFIPGDLTGEGSGHGKRKGVANRLYLEIEDIDCVRVMVDPFEPVPQLLGPPTGLSNSATRDLYPDEQGVIELYAANDCNLKKILKELKGEMPAESPTDFDFRYHFMLLNEATISAVGRAVGEFPFPVRLSAIPKTADVSGDLRSSVVSFLSGAPFSKEDLLDELVTILIELLSANGCNCLRGGGAARLFDLEYVAPSSATGRSSPTQPTSSKTKGKKGV